ncbi:MAG TPA: hypothetical protein VKR58_00335 [Aquella sp.]|nr:hypothetical protein [Aquella sp.]
MIHNILKSYKTIFTILTFICVVSASADNNNDELDAKNTYDSINGNSDKFDVQKFVNSDETYTFNSTNGTIKLFTIERTGFTDNATSNPTSANCGPHNKELNCIPFDNFNLDEANLFAKQDDSKRVYFDRGYRIVSTMPISGWLTSDMEAYNVGVYPMQKAMDKVAKACNLENEQLTEFSTNKPASYLPAIVYVITTKNKHGICSQSLFDTYRKQITCQVMNNVDCYL